MGRAVGAFLFSRFLRISRLKHNIILFIRAHMRLRSRRYAPAQREIRSSPRAAHHHESCKHAPAKREILSSCQKIEPSMVVEDEDDYEDARSTPILPITWTFCRSYSMAFSRRSREAV